MNIKIDIKVIMILKRYEYWASENGKPIKKWTEWFNYNEDDSLLPVLQKNEKYQLLNPKLKNEFRIV